MSKTDAEFSHGRMSGHVAAALCLFVLGRSASEAVQKGLAISDRHMVAWRIAEDALVDIGVMELQPLGDSGHRYQVFTMDAVEMPEYLATRVGEGDPRIETLLAAFLGIACAHSEYRDNPLSDERDWFDPPTRYITAMEWLSLGGYADRDSQRFRWTDKIGPAMRANQYWTEDNCSETSIENARTAEEAQLAWASMPQRLKDSLKSNEINALELALVLSRSWRDGEWREPDDLASFGWRTLLAYQILEIAKTS